MSFGGPDKIPQRKQNPLGLSERRLPTNEQARPVPVIYGRNRVGITFLSQAFNQKSTPVLQEVGKKSEPVTTGYNYFCDFAALVGHGPMDGIHEIWFDNEKVWPLSGDGIVRDDTNQIYCDITIENYGTWKFYWGTEYQTINSSLAALWGEEGPTSQFEKHPAYVGQCYFVATQQFLGYQKTNVQSIEVVVSRYPSGTLKFQGFADGWLGDTHVAGDANAVACIVDVLVNDRYGLGLNDVDATDTNLYRAGLVAVATQVKKEFGISPVVARQQAFMQVLQEWCNYNYLYPTATVGGLFTLGMVREREPGSTIVTIDELCAVSPPRLTNPGWGTISTQVALKFTNAANAYKEDVAQYVSLSGLQNAGDSQPTTIDRPAVTRHEIADKLAQIQGKILSQPHMTGTVVVRNSKLQGLNIGDEFLLNWAHWSLCNLHCRVTAMVVADPFRPDTEIEFEVDRGNLTRAVAAPTTYSAPQQIINRAPTLEADAFRAIELPFTQKLTEEIRVGFLVGRPTLMSTRWVAHLQKSDGGYRSILASGSWAFYGTLISDYDFDATGQIELLIHGKDFASNMPGPTEADANEDAYILLVATDDGEDEIMSVYGLTVTDSLRVKYSVKRERFDCRRRSHVAGARWWLINASKMLYASWTHDGVRTAGTTSKFKLQTIVLGRPSDLSEALEKNLVLTDRIKRPWKPKSVTCSTSTFNLATTITLSWTQTDRRGSNHNSVFWDGPGWVIQIRKSTESFGGASTKEIGPLKWETSSYSTSGSGIKSLLGLSTLESVRIRVFSRSGSYDSRGYDEFLVTYVP